MQNQGVDMQAAIQAFELLVTPNTPNQTLKQADRFISSCENYPEFMLNLITLFRQCGNTQTKWQILIHLKNVIKRNWTSKRKFAGNRMLTGQIKQQIKQQLLELYKEYWQQYNKQFNRIFQYLARQDFPANYQSLHRFTGEVLSGLGGLNMDSILQAQQLLPFLSLVKCVYKQYADRRILHSEENYHKYIVSVIQLALPLLHKVQEALVFFKNSPNAVPMPTAKKLFECSRKVDKIILYCIRCMVSPLQGDSSIAETIKLLLSKLQFLLGLKQQTSNDLQQEVEKNILAILESVSKLQSMFPLVFTSFLGEYLHFVTNLLNVTFLDQKLTGCVLQANINPLNCFVFYMDEQKFASSLQCKKGTEQAQKVCHSIFLQVYNPGSINIFMEKIVSSLMVQYKRHNADDEIVFEDAEVNEASNEQGLFQKVISLLKAILTRFPTESKRFSELIVSHLLSSTENSVLTNNMYEVLLLLPKVQQEDNLPISTILSIVQKCYSMRNYDIFCRFIRMYHNYVDQPTSSKFFEALVTLIGTPGINHHTVYQSAVCLQKLLAEHENNSQLPVTKMGACLASIFSLLDIYKQIPTHLWNLLNLLIQILKTLPVSIIQQNLTHISNSIGKLSQGKQISGTIISALSQLMRNILALTSSIHSPEMNNFITVCLKVVQIPPLVEPQDLQVSQDRYRLLFSITSSIHPQTTPPQTMSKVSTLVVSLKAQLCQDNPTLLLQLLQQSVVSSVVTLSPQDLQHLHKQIVSGVQACQDPELVKAFYSLSLTMAMVTQSPVCFVGDVVAKLAEISFKVSQRVNALRTLLVFVLSSHIIMVGCQGFDRNGLWEFLKALETVNDVYVRKVATLALLNSMKSIRQPIITKVGEDFPLDLVLKVTTNSTKPLNYAQALKSYSKCTHPSDPHPELLRSVQIHINQAWLQVDADNLYRQEIGQIMRILDWGQDDLQERYSQELVTQIVSKLGGSF